MLQWERKAGFRPRLLASAEAAATKRRFPGRINKAALTRVSFPREVPNNLQNIGAVLFALSGSNTGDCPQLNQRFGFRVGYGHKRAVGEYGVGRFGDLFR